MRTHHSPVTGSLVGRLVAVLLIDHGHGRLDLPHHRHLLVVLLDEDVALPLELLDPLRELLEAEGVVLLHLVVPEELDVGRADVLGGLLRVVVVGDHGALGEAPVDLAAIVEAAVGAPRSLFEVSELEAVPDLRQGLLLFFVGFH